MRVPDLSNPEGKGCVLKVKHIRFAMRFAVSMETSSSLRVRPKLLWRKAGHCKRNLYRYLTDRDPGWNP